MGSPITFSGFNQIDFNLILNAVMQQEQQPLQGLTARQQSLKDADGVYATLNSKLASLRTAADGLSERSTVFTQSASTSDAQSVAAQATTGAVPGRNSVVVSQLARAQVMASQSTAPDTTTTTVASGGSMTIGTTTITLAGSVSLQGLADAINADASTPATASIMETAPGAFRLVLTAKNTGASGAFTVTSALTGSTIAFTDTDTDGTSGDSAADNAVQAADAIATINGVSVTSASNTLTTAVTGVELTLLKADPANTVVIDVTRDDDDLSSRVDAFVSAFNDLSTFADAKLTPSGPLGGDPVMRGLRAQLRAALNDAYGAGAFTRLAEVGIGFTRSGALEVNHALLSDALHTNPGAVASLFADATSGAFGAIESLAKEYTQAGGFVPSARTRLAADLSRIANQIADMQERLALRRAALQREFTAADEAMTRLNAQSGAMSAFGSGLSNVNL